MKNRIISNYNGEEHKKYKSLWKHAYKTAAKDLKLDFDAISHEDEWKVIEEELPSPYKSQSGPSLSSKTSSNSNSNRNTSSLEYQKKLISADYIKLKEIHSKIKNKWILSSGTNVEDTIYNVSKTFNYAHPAHSMILNPNDPSWFNHFGSEDLVEIKEHVDHSLNNDLPKELKDILLLLNQKTTFRAIYDAMNAVPADPVNDKEKYWLKNSIINYVMLFVSGPTIVPFKSEEDLLDDVYGFIKTSKQLSNTNTEKKTESTASSEEINKDRLIGSISKINRKIAANHADLVFKYLTHELGCVEIGLYNKGPTGTKELQEFEIKTPLMLKSFILHLVKDYKAMPNNFKVISFVISGMYITAQVMTCNKGSVALVGTSQRYHMPESSAEVPKLLPPVLKLVYNCAMVIESTTSHLKAISSSVSLGEGSKVYFPPCFVAGDNKRTHAAAFSD
ncbi:hypothetical protein RMCBS344292_02629 [Rhizopus microsporus]|nr:hypothetical protein RMCBS344292_02629 [Rhizopus microsporus]